VVVANAGTDSSAARNKLAKPCTCNSFIKFILPIIPRV
jgi:hypothetical protein